MVLAAWLSSMVTTQRYTDKLAARDNSTIKVLFLSFVNCSPKSLVSKFPSPAFLIFDAL